MKYAVVVLGKQVDHKNLKGTLTQLNSTNDIPYLNESNVGEIKFQEKKIFPTDRKFCDLQISVWKILGTANSRKPML